jgi:ATP-grasp domain, R2K clade family 3
MAAMSILGDRRVHFLYPAVPFALGVVDDTFKLEAEAMREAGFSYSTLSIEDLEAGNFKVCPRIPEDAIVVYRGWMLEAERYARLVAGIESVGAQAHTNLETYLSCHHLPNWYAKIADLTPETRVFAVDTDLETELRALGWGAYFIKDFVKSLKTSIGSIISRPEDINALLDEMQKFRGQIEGGIVVRRLEPIDAASERRYFVIHGRAFAPDGEAPQIVHVCAERVQSLFFSVDVVTRNDGELRVIEVGDGQVSDLVGWSPERFARAWAELLE